MKSALYSKGAFVLPRIISPRVVKTIPKHQLNRNIDIYPTTIITLTSTSTQHYHQHHAKTNQLTKDDSIKFMAAACVFSLAQSAELCQDIAESGAADLALEDLARGGCPGQGGQEESEFLLTQLAVVAQVR